MTRRVAALLASLTALGLPAAAERPQWPRPVLLAAGDALAVVKVETAVERAPDPSRAAAVQVTVERVFTGTLSPGPLAITDGQDPDSCTGGPLLRLGEQLVLLRGDATRGWTAIERFDLGELDAIVAEASQLPPWSPERSSLRARLVPSSFSAPLTTPVPGKLVPGWPPSLFLVLENTSAQPVSAAFTNLPLDRLTWVELDAEGPGGRIRPAHVPSLTTEEFQRYFSLPNLGGQELTVPPYGLLRVALGSFHIPDQGWGYRERFAMSYLPIVRPGRYELHAKVHGLQPGLTLDLEPVTVEFTP